MGKENIPHYHMQWQARLSSQFKTICSLISFPLLVQLELKKPTSG